METELVSLQSISLNERNPRNISEKNFNRLVDSVLSFPKMLELRPIVVNDRYISLGGNMRLRALLYISQLTADEIELRLKSIKKYQRMTDAERVDLLDYWETFLRRPEVVVVIADSLISAEYDEFVIKDNVGFGDWNWDELANEWDQDDLQDWGLDIPNFSDDDEKDGGGTNNEPTHECPNCGHLW